MWDLASHNQPGSGGPCPQVDKLCEFDDFGTASRYAPGIDRGCPGVIIDESQSVTNPAGDLIAGTEPDVAGPALLGEPVRHPTRIGPHHQLFGGVVRVVTALMPGLPHQRERSDRVAEQNNMIRAVFAPALPGRSIPASTSSQSPAIASTR